uniref:Complex I assembly factor TIMMDC1, mitochondrial n=1 Tax=Elaeophora elaphi TaxID=1147741 RepID=A0A0R3S3I5_9BILA
MPNEERGTLWSKFDSIPNKLLQFFTRNPEVEDKAVAEIGKTADNSSSNGWQRLKNVYTNKDVHFETSILMPCMEWTFIGTVFLTGPLGWQRAADRYNRYARGRIFLNPHDALRRKWDYAFVSFLRMGAISGTLASLYVGCMVATITHVAAWRGHFSLWTIPVITTSIPSVIACPLGLKKMMQAASIGLTCGLTLSLIVFGISRFSNQTVDCTYQQFKREHELMLRAERIKEESVKLYQKEHKIWSRSVAKFLMYKNKKLEDEISENPSK